MARPSAYTPPVIGEAEPKDQHNKFYAEKSVSAAIERYRKRKGIRSYSLACREIVLKGFEHDDVFGGYEIK